jgi:mannose-1-phosphate guanylyltransferase
MPELAIDYLIEKLNNVFVIPVDLGWDDIGSWEAIKNISTRISGNNNVVKGNNISIDNKDTLIYAQDKLIAVLGVKNLIVVDTKDAILICDKNSSQDVKKIIELLKNNKDTKYL